MTDDLKMAPNVRFGYLHSQRGGPLVWGIFGVALALLIFIAAISYRSISQSMDSARWVNHTHEVRLQVEELSRVYSDLLTAWQAFVIDSDMASLAEFHRNAEQLAAGVEALHLLTRDNPAQQTRLAVLGRFLARDTAALSASITRRLTTPDGDPEEEIARMTRDELNRDELLYLVVDVRLHEEKLLAAREAEWQDDARRAVAIIIVGYTVALAMLVGIFVLLRREIRRRRDAESAAQHRAAEIEDLYHNAPCGYHSLDADGVFVRVNDTELRWLGYDREEVVGVKRLADVLTPASRPVFQSSFSRFRETGAVQDVEYDMERKDGTILSVSISATAIRDRDGALVMSRSTVFDITERRRAAGELGRLNAELNERAMQLESANKELESFSYSVSHDLRSPLRAVSSFARMLEEDYGKSLDQEGRRLLTVIRDSSRKMGQLIDDLLAFSRLGRKPIGLSQIDMAEQVRSTFAELVNGDDRVRLDVGSLPPTLGDVALIRQVWSNLLSNAIKFSGGRDEPRLSVSGRIEAGESIYCVKDNGVGFDMEYYDKLFGVFQRLHSVDEFPGTGVGLAIVQRIVARHGGRVWAEGREGAGASFYFSLPGSGATESISAAAEFAAPA